MIVFYYSYYYISTLKFNSEHNTFYYFLTYDNYF